MPDGYTLKIPATTAFPETSSFLFMSVESLCLLFNKVTDWVIELCSDWVIELCYVTLMVHPISPFGLALHISNITNTPILKRELVKIPKCNLIIICGEHSFSFIAPSLWNLPPASLWNCAPVWVESSAQDFPVYTGLSTNLCGPHLWV